MKLTYDTNQNIAYITLREGKREEVATIQISDELNIDIASDGKIYGIEFLNANEQLRNNGSNNIRIVNENTGKEVMLELSI
jgi:uncharacterized protein YuzE